MKVIINRKTLVSMLFLGLTMLGYISFKKLPVELFPNAELPVLIVQINTQTEVDPRYIENQAVIPLEGAIGTLEGIEKIESSADARRGLIFVSFTQQTNIKYAYLKLQQKVDKLKATLPEEFFVNIIRVDTEQLSGQFMSLQVLGEGGVDRVRNVADQEIVNKLSDIDGVASAQVFGGRQKTIEIIMNDKICEAHGITPNTIRNVLSKNTSSKTYVGHVGDAANRYFVNVTAELDDIKNIQNLVVVEKGPLLLKDVAEVFFGLKEQTSLSRVNGKDAVSIQLVKDTQVNIIDLSHRTIDAIEVLNNELAPKGVEINIQFNQAEIMEKNINQIINLALVGGLLAVFILWIFLRKIRLVITMALSIPVSVFTAFNFFYAFDISVNSLTLVGMALAIGMLLDNSVVVIENIYRHVANRRKADEAVILGTKEIWRSVFAATLTTITVFVPFIFSENYLVKLIGTHIGVSIISTLVVSLAVALILVPMLTHYVIKRSPEDEISLFRNVSIRQRLIQIYILTLKACLRYPARTTVGSVVIFFIAILICLWVSVGNLREIEQPELSLFVNMPQGSTLAATDEIVRKLEEQIEPFEEKEQITSIINEGEARLGIKLKEDFEKIGGQSVEDVKTRLQELARGYRNAEITMDQQAANSGSPSGGGQSEMGGFERLLGIGSERERILIKGQDFELMKTIARDLRSYLGNLASIRRSFMNINENRPEAHILFDQHLMSEYDISLNNVMAELGGFQKEFSSGIKFKHGIDEYDITIRNGIQIDEEPRSMDDLKKLVVKSNTGANYELQKFSNVVYATGTSGIRRLNQEKQIELTYSFIQEVLDSESLLEASRLEIDELVANINVPSGVAIEVIHEETGLEDFYFLIIAAIVIIFMILASVFESLYLPFVIMFSIPMAAVGAFLGLIFTGNSLFNANTLIGFLILLGVVVNNGIILIDYSRILRKRGYSQSRSLIMAGISRIRPISITTITTIVAMLPLAMGQAEYVSAIGAPFAITVMGGLALSTFLTLVFIPTVSSGLESSLRWFGSLTWVNKITQLMAMIGLAYLIYTQIDSLLWQILCFFLTIVLVPGASYFIMTSLRQANSKLIGPNEKISIHIQNLVKIYGRDKRFIREWKASKKIYHKKGDKISNLKGAFAQFSWKMGIAAFLVYFIYFFLGSYLWQFIIAHLLFFAILGSLAPFKRILEEQNKIKGLKLVTILYNILFWGFPLFNLFYFLNSPANNILVSILAVIWFFGLWIYHTGQKLNKKPIEISTIRGKFGGLRRGYYRLVYAMPLIGAKKQPFRALSNVNLTIEHGMFGLLGPNGAGKTTLMRIICGILEQSYGKVWINGIDTTKKREELQGLIGYLPQAFGTYENMSPYDFLSYQAILKGIVDKNKREEIVQYVLKAVHMDEHQNKKIGSFSGGMKQRIGIAQILLHLPKILVVDEPTAGLDPLERIRFRNLLVELSRDRIVIFSTHIIEDIASSCNQVGVLIEGNIEYLGNPSAMAEIGDGYVWEFYIDAGEFEHVKDKFTIVHHMKDGNSIRIRCLAEDRPTEDAVSVKANLEDSYLWLLKGKKEEIQKSVNV
ncbi:efflux RND transporter permease subunit [Fulvivirgaceae bacterium BMA10]|uniref:Efflux RND transporter permease subunit n=1 Tax=Splendidivirga corallicola TaxID=3051826 RepID=A0ABT8KR20_9BACT|nr:efflux RND transporter permease subunit [Fulvivirgaceae bacterium BMA10]